MTALLWIFLCAAMRADAETPLAQRLQGHCVAAHRGGYRFADSNTLARFEVARRAGADVIETDLRVSSDGVVFLFHDRDLDSATRCHGRFAAHTAREIEDCPLNGLGTPPDRFERALAWSQGRVVIDAELKTPEVARPAIDLVRKYGAYEWVYFQVRNDPDIYRTVRAYDRRVAVEAGPVGPDADRTLRELIARDDSRMLVIQLHPEALTEENLALLRASGKLVSIDAWRVGPERLWSVWPFPRAAACKDAWRQGVDIAVTNVPDYCARQRAQMRQ